MSTPNPFDTPCNFTSTPPERASCTCDFEARRPEYAALARPPCPVHALPSTLAQHAQSKAEFAQAAAARVEARLAEQARARAKQLELDNARLRAELEDTTLAVERAAGRSDFEDKWRAECERSSNLARELAHVRTLHEHSVANSQAAAGEFARALSNLSEIGAAVGVPLVGDGSQIRRAIALLQARSAVLDEVLDDTLDSMSKPAREILSEDAPDLGKATARHPVARELQCAGAVVFQEGWRWTPLGEALRHRRAERLDGRKRTGEYKAT